MKGQHVKHLKKALVDQFLSLSYLLVITSQGEQGSQCQFAVFMDSMQVNRDNLHIVEFAQVTNNQGENFTDLPSLIHCCKLAYQHLDSLGYHDDQIVFDATSGTKECSIAATISTLKKGRYLHYTDKHKQGTTFDIHE